VTKFCVVGIPVRLPPPISLSVTEHRKLPFTNLRSSGNNRGYAKLQVPSLLETESHGTYYHRNSAIVLSFTCEVKYADRAVLHRIVDANSSMAILCPRLVLFLVDAQGLILQ
jgi:hypothetical protein